MIHTHMCVFFFSSRRRHTRFDCDWSSDVCSSDLFGGPGNGTDGLNIDGSNVQVNFGVLTVDGNQGAGISMEGGRLQLYGGEADSRSEEGRVGEECRSRWWPDHLKKKKKKVVEGIT